MNKKGMTIWTLFVVLFLGLGLFGFLSKDKKEEKNTTTTTTSNLVTNNITTTTTTAAVLEMPKVVNCKLNNTEYEINSLNDLVVNFKVKYSSTSSASIQYFVNELNEYSNSGILLDTVSLEPNPETGENPYVILSIDPNLVNGWSQFLDEKNIVYAFSISEFKNNFGLQCSN